MIPLGPARAIGRGAAQAGEDVGQQGDRRHDGERGVPLVDVGGDGQEVGVGDGPARGDLDDARAPLAAVADDVVGRGPRGTVGKTMIVARPISVGPADPEAANPVPKPVVCE